MHANERPSEVSHEMIAKQLITESERLVWSGQPRRGIVIRPIDAVLIPFSVFTTCFFGVWSYCAVLWFPIPLKLLSILAVGFAFYLAYGRFLLDARRRRNTIYAVTTQRCLWIKRHPLSIANSMEHQPSRELTLVRSRSGGTIVFGGRNGLGFMYMRAMGIENLPEASCEFEKIDDAENVLHTIRDLASAV